MAGCNIHVGSILLNGRRSKDRLEHIVMLSTFSKAVCLVLSSSAAAASRQVCTACGREPDMLRKASSARGLSSSNIVRASKREAPAPLDQLVISPYQSLQGGSSGVCMQQQLRCLQTRLLEAARLRLTQVSDALHLDRWIQS